MRTRSVVTFQLGKVVLFIVLTCTYLTHCGLPIKDSPPTDTLPRRLPTGQIAFTSLTCDLGNSEIRLLTLPSGDVTVISQDRLGDRTPAWSPKGRLLGMLSGEVDRQILRIVEPSRPAVQIELGTFVHQYTWSADGTALFYLERDGSLYLYDLSRDKNEKIIEAVSDFSVSPNGRWLGLSIRAPTHSGAFAFRVLDLKSGRLLTLADHNDIGQVGPNRSVWSPTADEVAVLFGLGAAQSSKIVIYTVTEEYLHIRATVVARDTYRRDFAQDLPGAEFVNLTWSPDGQQLLAIRSTTDVQPGGEVLLFDASLSNYQRLPFGPNVTEVTWKRDGKWLVYVVSSDRRDNSNRCFEHLSGELWLAEMETLEFQFLVAGTLSIDRPSWRP